MKAKKAKISEIQAELRNLKAEWWESEKEEYKKIEIGSGSEDFVLMLFESALFGLSRGKLSTPLSKRRAEYLKQKSKVGRRADITIFVDSNVIIPVEVEKFENIEAGVSQIFQYKIDWERHQGILTDGFRWRFYTDNAYDEFTLDYIIENTEKFLNYWNTYTRPENYYFNLFDSKRSETVLPVEDYRAQFFDDITQLINDFKEKLEIAKFFSDESPKTCEKKALEISYAYIIQFILYKTLADNKFDAFDEKYKNIVTSIHNGLQHKQYNPVLTSIKAQISDQICEKVYRKFKAEQEYIDKKLKNLIYKAKNTIADVAPWLDILVFIKKYNFANVRSEIFGYVYENYLKDYHAGEDKGQYFTDPHVVDFMLEQIGYTPSEIKKRVGNEPWNESLSLIDPACGSGTFLYSAVDRLVNNLPYKTEAESKTLERLVNTHLFGLDIEEFPLYLAEMSMIMRMLPIIIHKRYNNPLEKKFKLFETKDSIAEFINDNLDTDKAITSFMRDEAAIKECKSSIKNNEIPRRRFDYVVGNPPYISYRACSDQELPIMELMKDDKVPLSDVYGMNLHSVPGRRKVYEPKPNLFAFFIALSLELLKDNGKLCFIIPQTILVNNEYDVLRYHLANFTTIERIFCFRRKVFVNRGVKQEQEIVTSSLIFVVDKKKPATDHIVEFVNYNELEDEIDVCLDNVSKGNKVYKHCIKQSELLENVNNWHFYKRGKRFIDFYKRYRTQNENFNIYYEHAIALPLFNDTFYFDGSTNIPKRDIIYNSVDDLAKYYKVPTLKSEGFLAKLDGYYPKDKKIKRASGSQGLVYVKPKYKILWKYKNFDQFYFCEGEDILPKYQEYCITSDNEEEMLYLFGLLISDLTQIILHNLLKIENESKLDSLFGMTSIKELIKVPRIGKENKKLKKEISKLTRELLDLENVRLMDLVDFTNVRMQQLNAVQVETDDLVLSFENRMLRLPIRRLIKQVSDAIAGFAGDSVELEELKDLKIIDHEEQAKILKTINKRVDNLYELNDEDQQTILFEKFIGKLRRCKTLDEKKELWATVPKEERRQLTSEFIKNGKGYAVSWEEVALIKELIR